MAIFLLHDKIFPLQHLQMNKVSSTIGDSKVDFFF